ELVPAPTTSRSRGPYRARAFVSCTPMMRGEFEGASSVVSGGAHATAVATADRLGPPAWASMRDGENEARISSREHDTVRLIHSSLLGLRHGLQFGDALVGLREILALFEFLQKLLEIRQGFRLLLHLHQCFAEVEVDGVAAGVLLVLFQQGLEPVDRAGPPALAKVEVADEIIRLVETIFGLAQFAPDFGHQAAVRI